MLTPIQNLIQSLSLPGILVIGMMILAAFYAGKSIRHIRLPAVIGFLLTGALMGPSVLNIISEELQRELDFITQIALGAVALGIGLELGVKSIWQKGPGVLILTLSQMLATMFVVTAGIYLLTKNMALAMILGAISTTTEPAGTMAVIQESRARGPLTSTLYAVIGFDNGLGIIVFGFATAIAREIVIGDVSVPASGSMLPAMLAPVLEVFFSLGLGVAMGAVFCVLLRTNRDKRGILIQTFAVIFITIGVCRIFDLSYLFALMVTGSVVVNTQHAGLLEQLRRELTGFMPLLYVLFFALAGTNLHLSALPAVGLVGVVYVLCRCAGKIGGAWYGARRGRLGGAQRHYTGVALLSQAGVAIGLALIVQSEFSRYGYEGAQIGITVLTTVSAACIIFELTGPLLAEKALKKAGEIRPPIKNTTTEK